MPFQETALKNSQMIFFTLYCGGLSLHPVELRPLADPLSIPEWQMKEYGAMVEGNLQGKTELLG